MYINAQSVLDNAEECDLYHRYMSTERRVLAGQRAEMIDRLNRLEDAWDRMTGKVVDDGGTYADYAKHAQAYIDAHNAVKACDDVIDATKARLTKYAGKFNN